MTVRGHSQERDESDLMYKMVKLTENNSREKEKKKRQYG